MIETINDVRQLATKDNTDWKQYGDVAVREKGDLLLFNYTPEALFTGRWNFFERVSRGLIVNRKTGEIVARPFDKFFNWGEGGRCTDADILNVTEKLDGSLGILYWYQGQFHIATRGSFDGDQAKWATEYLQSTYDMETHPRDLTLLFEIIYPENRIVVDYGKREDLVLLAARCTFGNGNYLEWPLLKKLATKLNFSLPTVSEFGDIQHILEAREKIDANNEGWVVEFKDGQRFKFKGKRYIELHKLVTGMSFKKTLEAVSNNKVPQLRNTVPDEFLGEFNLWVSEIESRVSEVKALIETEFQHAPKQTRKEFALWANKKDVLTRGCLFARLDNKPLDQIIYKHAFK